MWDRHPILSSSIVDYQTSNTLTPRSSLLESLRIQVRVIGALLLREILTRYGRKNIGFLWLFIDPMIFTSMIAVFWSITRAHQFTSLSLLAFAVTGYSSVHLWRTMPSLCLSAQEPNSTLLYHKQVRPMDFYLTRIILEGAGATIALVFLILLLAGTRLMPWPVDSLKLVGGWLMLAWFGAALGLFVGALGERIEIIPKIWTPISYLLFPFSGAVYLLYQLPPQAREVLLWLPMVHGVEYMREGYFGPVVPFFYDLSYVTVFNLCLTLLGLSQVRYVSRNITPQ
jgi:capsular polysaccharide transport system permease protein